MKKVLSLLLVLSMLIGMMPMTAFATEGTQEPEAVEVVTEPTEAPEEETTTPAEDTEETEPSDEEEEEESSEPSESEEEAEAVHEHDYEAVVTDPTCTEQGYTTYTCKCGDSYVDDYVDAADHNYAEGTCTVCGEADPDYSEPAWGTWVAFGTSITEDKDYMRPNATNIMGTYIPYLSELMGVDAPDANYSIGGAAFSTHLLMYIYYAKYQKSGLTYNGYTHTAIKNADLITIEGGVNDFYGSVPLGKVGDTVPYSKADPISVNPNSTNNFGGTTDGTFAGCIYAAITELRRVAPDATIVFITDNAGTGSCAATKANALGHYLHDYNDMMTAVAESMGCYVIDAGRTAGFEENLKTYLSDHIHQSEAGGEAYANAIWRGLCAIRNGEQPESGHTHRYTESVTAPTCTEKGYTTYTCTCGDSYRISWLDESAYEGKTIACIGDSITAAVGVTKDENDYVKLLADRLSMNYIRLGASGTTLCTDGSRTCNIGRLTEGYLKNADIVTIAMGINDFCAAGEGYYELGSIISTDSSTIYGAVRMWCERIEELRATDSLCDTQFYFVTPVICSWNNSVTNKKDWDQSKENIHGYTLRDLCNAIIEVAELYDVGVIDLNLLSGMYYVDAENNNTAVFGGDGVHPGAGGHAMMANAIANALLQNNLRDDHAHTFGSWITTTWPSCTEGEQQRVCSVCSAVEHRSAEPAKDHTYVSAITAPTCTEQGYTTYTCECGDSYVSDYVDATGHTYENGICTDCGATIPNPYVGKTIACVGDSITCGVGVTVGETDYVTLLAKSLGMEYIRLGVSGTTLCTGGHRTCNLKQLTEAKLAGADVVTILMGINDFDQAKEGYYTLGTIDSTDTSTIYGAVHMWCQRIEELRKTESLADTEFYFLTPVITAWNHSVSAKNNWDQSKTTIHGYTLRDLCNAIIEVCALYDVPVIDLNLISGIYYNSAEDNNIGKVGGDGIHPGANGHAMMAFALENALLKNNLKDDHTHTFGSWITTTWPSCTEGEQQRVCSVCSAVEHRSAEPAKDHTYVSAITVPTCTEQGYTTYTCICGDSYVDDYVDAIGHTYKSGICAGCGAEHPNLANYKGKVISIMGDSISTFKGYIPVADGFNEEHPHAYPARDVQSWDKTWWGLVINSLDAKLGINDSWSGSRVHNYSTADNPGGNIGVKVCMSSITRVSNLGANGTPDIIFVYGGTNDGKFSPFGGFDPSRDYSQVDLDAVTWKTFEDAYVAMIQRMQHYYPEAKIIALLPTPVASWYTDEKLATMNSSIKEICNYFGVDYVDLPECGITLADLPDGLHPNAAGMSYIADAVLEVLLNTNEEAGENVVHSITHNLNGATASKGYYKGVSNNKSFEETLTGAFACVSVTMNGVDITKSCYQNGTVSIPSVNGDVVITEKDHSYENGICTGCGSVSAETVANGTCGDALTWTLDKNGVLTISGTGKMYDYGYRAEEEFVVNPPWNKYKNEIITVVIEDGITNIGQMAFEGCSNLTGIELSKDLTAIGTNAFSNCSALANVRLPETVTSMGNFAFSGCKSLTSVEIPAGVTTIGSHAFSNCSALVTVKLPAGITQISDRMFNGCAALASIEIPTGVTGIGDYAFFGCKSLATVELPNGLVNIGDYAFGGCAALTDIVLPESLVSIGNSAFSTCSSLTGIVIPDAVTELGNSVFYNCYNLKNVELPANITSIGEWVFYGCGLTSIDIPDSVTHINDYAFYSCDYLTSVEIPDSVVSIGIHAFCDCIRLTNIKLPDGLESIGNGAFERCESLDMITFTGDAPSIAESAFANVKATVYYPAGNATWTANARQNYGASVLTWTSYCEHTYENGICTGCGELEADGIWQIVENNEVIGAYADLQSAIDACETGGTVRLTADCAVTSGVKIKKDITIDGGNFLVDISGCIKEFIHIEKNAAVTLRDLKLDGGATGFEVDYDAVTYTNYTIPLKAGSLDNDPMAETSAIISFSQKLICENVDISNRYTASYGAAMQIRSGILELTDCDFSHNYGSKQGGALYIANSFGTMTEYPITSVTINNCTFTENYTGHGGAIYAMNVAQMSITNSLFDRNTANGGKGGAIDLPGQNITKPVAKEKGLDYMQTTIHNCVFSNNWAGNDGFAIQSYDSELYITDTEFVGNVGVHPTSSVGTVSIEHYRGDEWPLYVRLNGCLFEGNQGPCAAYGDHDSPSELEVSNCTFRGNKGNMSALLYSSTSNFTNCQFVNETMATAVIDARSYSNYQTPPKMTLTDVSFTDCDADAEILTRKQDHNDSLNTYQIVLQGTTNGDIAIWDNNAVSVQGNHTGNVQRAFDTERSSLTIGEDASVNGIIYAQPQNAEAPLSDRYCVSAEAEGKNLKYQWYFRNAGSKNFSKSSVKDNTYDDVMTAARAGREVYCVITDSNGNSVTTDTVKLICTPSEELAITKQPTDGEAVLGERYCVTVEAKGDGLKYQWYFRNAGSDIWHTSSVRDNTYDDVMTRARAGREIYCVVTDAYGNSATTDVVTLVRIPIKLEIISQPTDVSACFDDRFCATVEAMGEGLKYKWYFRSAGSDIWYTSGVRDNTYDDIMTKARNGREIYCVITDEYGNSVTTDVVKLIAVPKLELKLLGQTYESAVMGERYCVTVEAEGDGLTYQWYFRNAGTNAWYKSSVRDNTYDDVMTKARAGRDVYCVITDTFGNQVTTEVVTLELGK